MKKTPLVTEHEKLGARMVDFAGWYMPVQYKGLREEHLCVRNQCGLFDVSHMGEIRFKGPKALASLEWMTTNQVENLKKGQAQYSLIPNEQGGLIDDIIIYCLEENADYLVCVNASNIEKDFNWFVKHNKGADIINESDLWGQIAVQGPRATELLNKFFDLDGMNSFELRWQNWNGIRCGIATTGYTGEKGGEIFVPAEHTAALWKALLEKGAEFGTQPIGLGARDTLRTEMKYPLYGHEIDEDSHPTEAGLGWVFKIQQKDFLGKAAFVKKTAAGLKQKLVGFKFLERGIPRQGYPLLDADKKTIGRVTSGTMIPPLDVSIGIGYVDKAFTEVGSKIWVDVRGRAVPAEVVKTPFK